MPDSIDDMIRRRAILQDLRSVPAPIPMKPSESDPQAYTRFTRTPVYLTDVSKMGLLDQIGARWDQPGFENKHRLSGPTESTGEYGLSDRIQANYGPEVDPKSLMDTILHEDVHALLRRGLGLFNTPSLMNTPEEAAAIKGFRKGDPNTGSGPRAGIVREELPAYVAATPYSLGGLSSEQREKYIDDFTSILAETDPGLARLYRRMSESYSGTHPEKKKK